MTDSRREYRLARAAMMAAGLFLIMTVFAHGQPIQTTRPAASGDRQLLDRLYPGNSREIERRLGTSSTLSAASIPANRPTTTPTPLVLRLRRKPSPTTSTVQSAHVSKATTHTVTTRTLIMPIRPRSATRPATATTADMGLYLSSLGPARTNADASNKPAGGSLAPVPVPIGTLGAQVRINHADETELMQKLKLDARRARMVIEFRTYQGKFRTPDDLGQVNGLTDDMIDSWEQQGLLRFD